MTKLRLLIFGLCALLPVLVVHEYERRLLASHSIQRNLTTQGAVIPPALRSLRPNYPYSVVPGGVYSPDELRAAIDKYPLVREHYADFNLHSARLLKLTEDQSQYVSFRLANHIFWTRNKLRIPKGEVLVSDGISYARTRCGNRLSDVPNSNTTPLQPPDELLSLPAFTPELIPQLSFSDGPPPTATPILPFDTPPPGLFPPMPVIPPVQTAANWPPLQHVPSTSSGWTSPPYTTSSLAPHYQEGPGNFPIAPVCIPTKPPVVPPVPEPGTLSLFGAGLFVSVLLLRRMSRSARLQEQRSAADHQEAANARSLIARLRRLYE